MPVSLLSGVNLREWLWVWCLGRGRAGRGSLWGGWGDVLCASAAGCPDRSHSCAWFKFSRVRRRFSVRRASSAPLTLHTSNHHQSPVSLSDGWVSKNFSLVMET